MKKTLTEIFDEADIKELDIVFGKNSDIEATDVPDNVLLERIKTKVFEKTHISETRQRSNRSIIKITKWIALAAAGFLLIISVGLGSYSYAAELKEYKTAVSFFNEYGLSTAGLSRGEIKAVYQDITTESFTYSKTAAVIAKSISESRVDGFEIAQNYISSEDIENMWNYKNYNSKFQSADGTGSYKYYSEYKPDEERGFDVFDKSCLEKYNEDGLLWSVSFNEFIINGYTEVTSGVIVFGNKEAQTGIRYSWISKIDDEGNVEWTRMLDNGFGGESIAEVIENDDGTYAVFSRGDLEYFCLSQYDAEGNVQSFKKTEIGIRGIWNVARFGDGYIVQLGNNTLSDSEKIVKVDKEGNILDSFTYDSEDTFYFITDMIEFDEKIYLSAYAVPKKSTEYVDGYRYEIDNILNYIFEKDNWDISDEELTPIVRDNYKAMLLVCNPDGIPKEFYSVKGSLGGKLLLDDESKLLWDVESITTTFFSPATSSFTIGGTCNVFRYTFDADGTLISQENTGETSQYRR